MPNTPRVGRFLCIVFSVQECVNAGTAQFSVNYRIICMLIGEAIKGKKSGNVSKIYFLISSPPAGLAQVT